MKPHLQDRAQLQNLPSDIQSILSKYKPQSQVDTREPPPAKSRKRCRLCGRAKNRVTAMRYSSCNDLVCKDHAKTDVKCDICAHLATDKSSQRTFLWFLCIISFVSENKSCTSALVYKVHHASSCVKKKAASS